MALRQRLQVRQAQSLVMTPQLQQAIKLLQMSSLELSAYVEAQLIENPLLEICESEAGDSLPASERVEAGRHERGPVDFGGGSDGRSSRDGGDWEALAESPVSLRQHLNAQIGEEFRDPIIRRVATLIADNLDEAGYFVGDIAEMVYMLGVSRQTLAEVHQRFLQFDPPGIGARSIRECLAVQLAEMGALDAPMQCLLDHLDLIGRGDFQRLARLCGTDLGGLHRMMGRLKSCAPRPAAAFDYEPVQTLVPDVLISRTAGGGWGVELNQDALPQVLANRTYYAAVRRQTRSKEAADFVAEQWQAAQWLVKALDQRANTILKTAVTIVERQHSFFEEGISGLRPMTLKDVAESIGMHESTVSRVTNGKYAATPRGVLELKFFFSNAITDATGAGDHSAAAVRYRLRQMIEGETIDKVLSDEKLVEILAADGISVARRTVAKYRESMSIPPSSRRRRLLRLEAG